MKRLAVPFRLAWRWLRAHWVIYALLFALLVIIGVLVMKEQRTFVYFAIFALAIALVVLEYRVRHARQLDDNPAERVAFGAILLVVGLGAVAVGLANVDLAFYFGVASSVIAGGMLYSELRLSGWPGRGRGPTLMAIALALLVAAILVPPGRAFVIIALVALIVGELGTELTSEDSHALVGRGPTSIRVVGASVATGGALVAMVGFSLLVAVGADPVLALALLGIVAVFVVMASVDSDSLLIVVAIAIALGVAIQPTSDSIDPATEAAPGEPYFVVLGDSYISGEGADRFLEGTNTRTENPDGDRTNECRQASTAWPFVLAEGDDRPEVVPRRLLFLGCSGAVTENLHTLPREDVDGMHGPAELALFERRQRDRGLGTPALVVVSIGGNDAGFSQIGQNCVGPGSCVEVGQQFIADKDREAEKQTATGPPGKGHPEPLASIHDDLTAAYDRIETTFGRDVPVVAVPYPIPFTESARCRGVLLDRDERTFVVEYAKALNRQVEVAAGQHGFHYLADMERALHDAGVALCAGTGVPAGLNFIALNPKAGTVFDRLNPLNWTHNSLHPNAVGHEAMAAAARRWFARHPELSSGTPNPDVPSASVPTLKELMGGRAVTQCGDAPRCRVDGGHWISDQAHELYAESIVPLSVATLGLWLLALPVLWLARRRHWSTRRVLDGVRARA